MFVARNWASVLSLFLASSVFPAAGMAQSTVGIADREVAKPLIRGGIVYKNYCVVCHGDRGDGAVKAAKLYTGLNLSIKPRTTAYYDKIIRQGGEAAGASKFMPPWQDELSTEQISDVIAFLNVILNPVQRGEVVFKTNCVLCHGESGNGKGRAATLFNPPPADLTQSDKSDEYKLRIIREGGQAMGRSQAMPAWSERLSHSEIEDVVKYLQTILTSKPSSLR